MPRGKKKGGKKKTDSRPTSDEEYDTGDNVSTASVLSDDIASIAEEGDLTEVDETSVQEAFEDKLKECIDGLTQKRSILRDKFLERPESRVVLDNLKAHLEKSVKGRQSCLVGINKAFSNKYLCQFLMDRKDTVTDGLCRCLKKGKGEEQALAATCAALLSIQLGQEAESCLEEFRPVLIVVMTDDSASLKARAKCAMSLAVCSFVASREIEHVKDIMDKLSSVFKSSYKKSNNVLPSHSPEVCALHAAALEGWTSLLTIAPSFLVSKLITSDLPRLPDLLESADVDLRIAAGETIALLYELAREEDEDFEGDNLFELCESLKKLATDSNKFRAKKDRRQQRSSFRDILRAVEEGEAPETLVRFGRESLEICSWVHKRQYDTFCQLLGTGMNQHLLENDLIRDVFDLGSPIPTGTPSSQKISRTQRHLFNAAAFKARTKARAKHRDKRAVTANGSY